MRKRLLLMAMLSACGTTEDDTECSLPDGCTATIERLWNVEGVETEDTCTGNVSTTHITTWQISKYGSGYVVTSPDGSGLLGQGLESSGTMSGDLLTTSHDAYDNNDDLYATTTIKIRFSDDRMTFTGTDRILCFGCVDAPCTWGYDLSGD